MISCVIGYWLTLIIVLWHSPSKGYAMEGTMLEKFHTDEQHRSYQTSPLFHKTNLQYKRLLMSTLLLISTFSACSNQPIDSADNLLNTPMEASEVVILPSETSTPTITQKPTSTSPPTSTPLPSATSTVTPSPTPTLGVGSTKVSEIDGMVMVYVPAGEFTMGSEQNDSKAYNNEKPQRTVYLDPFWIDQTEVTNGMYDSCVNDGACQAPLFKSSLTRDEYYGNDEFSNYPIIFVSWENAATYCQWADKRLPTEAEWEKAARGTDGRIYPWGDEIDCQYANYWEYEYREQGRIVKRIPKGCSKDTVEVGSYTSGASPYGVMDMIGNVKEWVSDNYLKDYYIQEDNNNPQGPAEGKLRVIRGAYGLPEYREGSSGKFRRAQVGPVSFRNVFWPSDTRWTESRIVPDGDLRYYFFSTSTFRFYASPGWSDYSLGFRCALSL